ncbi:hypothetical protein HYFRA_00001386 [Hymenoscyphus fraxineus]|uniref:leucine--tRNA ligase n=1 Tax=Hymenoscyphus fraxineus TaxID=746836 RepID=A0A9N9L7K4_9HELO|nr:hypothetical protein HYFRA_00001386 [Hymenoscyphus fraxineus]
MLSIHTQLRHRLRCSPSQFFAPRLSVRRVQPNYFEYIPRRALAKDSNDTDAEPAQHGRSEAQADPTINHPPPALDLPRLDVKWQEIWQARARQRMRKSQDETLTKSQKSQALRKERYEDRRKARDRFVRGLATPEAERKEKKYILPMFPYPSGDLHLGHLRVYTISDVLSRFHRMKGYDVMHPIGWDAFGLPAENAAIERGIDPASWTKQNIEKMKKQLEAMNGKWDWDREFATCDPQFYKHTQHLFLLLHENGLAYQAESLVNYDPIDKTVLANEQVDANGNSWRSGAKVEKRMLKQWFFKISEFRQHLLDDLEFLSKDEAWPEKVLTMQKNWIGRSQGARIKFPVTAFDQETHTDIEVFTTRPDTLFGVQYLALASTHPMVKELAKTDVELQAFLDSIPALPPDSKVGYLLSNIQATNPLAGEEDAPEAIKASLPIFIAPYVLGDYGDGAVMGVPGHDVRDHGFWKHNRYDEPIRTVITSSPDESTIIESQPFLPQGLLTSHGGIYAGQTSANASDMILKVLEAKGLGKAAETWRLRDWLVSRQRYWGTPIPIIHCDDCGPVPVPAHQLPVKLPPVQEHWKRGKPGNPLEEESRWYTTSCPKCGNTAKRDTDTMDTFVDSSWYFMRFPDSSNNYIPFSPAAAEKCLPVDIYIGGVEHAILHLLYARFISKFIAKTGFWSTGWVPPGPRRKRIARVTKSWPTGWGPEYRGEPFKRVLTQGMVHGKTYSDPLTGRFLKPDECTITNSKPIMNATGMAPNVSFEKMSKSKYNGVDPTVFMNKYGADATRAHILFQAPVGEVLEWDEQKISGVTRWLNRIYHFLQQHLRPRLAERKKDVSITHFNPKLYFMGRSDGRSAFYEIPHDEYRRLTSGENRTAREKLYEKISRVVLPKIQATDEENRKLWRVVQETIVNVTASYNNGYSLNTVISDLMTLTNAILDTSKPRDLVFEYQATVALIKMMAPITPAFAEECWETSSLKLANKIKTKKVDPDRVVFSIAEAPFPEPDGTYEFLAPKTRPCSVQVNGKLKFVVRLGIPPEGLAGEQLEKWVVDCVLESEEGKERLCGGDGKGAVDAKAAKKVIVVQHGKGVNFVL